MAKSRKGVTVVTDDRAVALHARRLFAQAMGCEAFIRLLTEGGRRGARSDEKRTGKQTSGETEHWMKEFGLKEGEAPPRREAGGSVDPDDPDDLDIEGLLGPRG